MGIGVAVSQFHSHAQSLKVKNSGEPMDFKLGTHNGRLLYWPNYTVV